MQRASLSRRAQDPGHGSYVRSRSEERKLSSGEFDISDDKHAEEFLKNQRTLEEDDDGILDTDNEAKKVAEGEDDEFHDAVEATPQEAHAAGPSSRIHRRAMSDPFDTPLSDADMDQIRQSEEQAIWQEQQVEAQKSRLAQKQQNLPIPTQNEPYPTFPRFPVAATRDKNCWSEPPIQIYSVRGITYLRDKKKVPSSDYLLRTRGCDLFLFDDNVDITDRASLILGGHLRSLPTLAINFQFPWGSMILYFEIPDKLSKYVGAQKGSLDADRDRGLKTSAERVLAKWLQGDKDYKNERLKLIPYVAEGPWVVRNMVTGRPAIIGKKLPVKYQASPADPSNHLQPLLMCTLDIGSSSATAKNIVSVCRRYMSALTVDIGFVVQGDALHELPEQMMGAIRVHGPDPLKACRM